MREEGIIRTNLRKMNKIIQDFYKELYTKIWLTYMLLKTKNKTTTKKTNTNKNDISLEGRGFGA